MNLTAKQRIKKEEIIEAARIIFKTSGYKKTTMIDVAKATGNAKSSIYYYFRSKEDIFKSVILSEARIYRKRAVDSIERAETPHNKLKNYILIRLQTNNILSNFHRAINDKNLKHIKFIDKLKKIYDKEEYHIFSEILENGVNADYFEVYDLKNAAVGIVMAMRGIESTLLLNPDDPFLEEKVENILNVVLYGIIKR